MSLLGSLFGRKATLAKDPVCGMFVDPAKAEWSSAHGGTTFHFCGKTCKEAFDERPAYYIH